MASRPVMHISRLPILSVASTSFIISRSRRIQSQVSTIKALLYTLRQDGISPTSSCASTFLLTLTQADKLRTQQELERLQAKYIGTGHPDTTSWEWRTNIQRDTYSSIAGHRPLLSYIALAENEPIAKVRAQMIRKMVQPCGPPPSRED
ncbi:probable splicing factor 3B subunit 10 [Fusarium torulosum]|uniref:Probable splicing factor 3B subunit 10 n=1 Tax=Fusarium torulosum TaxID=33205 RepID=A0AAE8MHY8_9HYPO|nr:probable splicing factor 3B subunit 10 [Fusarium torulosum]